MGKEGRGREGKANLVESEGEPLNGDNDVGETDGCRVRGGTGQQFCRGSWVITGTHECFFHIGLTHYHIHYTTLLCLTGMHPTSWMKTSSREGSPSTDAHYRH